MLQFGASLTVINNAARVICYASNIYIIQATGANNRVDNKGVKGKHTLDAYPINCFTHVAIPVA
jgi:hypothetical protein